MEDKKDHPELLQSPTLQKGQGQHNPALPQRRRRGSQGRSRDSSRYRVPLSYLVEGQWPEPTHHFWGHPKHR